VMLGCTVTSLCDRKELQGSKITLFCGRTIGFCGRLHYCAAFFGKKVLRNQATGGYFRNFCELVLITGSVRIFVYMGFTEMFLNTK
jgi:hypothetical protein